MARQTKARVGKGGRTVIATFPTEALRSIVAGMDAGKERDALAQALAEADRTATECGTEERLDTPLSIEGLAPLGWMLAGSHSPLAYGAVRQGDFRQEPDGRWSFGPPGGFDRQDDGTVVMHDATQAGVMSQEHSVYRLLDPTPNASAAIADALRLEAEWRRELPAKRRRPRKLDDKMGVNRRDWHRYMLEEDLDGMPEGARISRGRGHYDNPTGSWRVSDIVHKRADHVSVYAFRCDAVLRPVRIHVGGNLGGATRTGEYRWTVGYREYDPSFDSMRPRPLTGPYDCVIGGVWSVHHNGRIEWDQAMALPQISTRWNSGGVDRRDNIAFPLASKAEADAAVQVFAIALGIVEGDATDMPAPIEVPDMAVGVDLAMAA